MKKTILILTILLITISCQEVTKYNIENNSSKELFNEIISAYKENDAPLVTIDFNSPLNPEWARKDYIVLRKILEESNPNIYRYHTQIEIDSLFNIKLDQLKDSINYFDFVRHIAETFNTIACGHSGWAHSNDFISFRNEALKFFPLKIKSIDNRYYITGNGSKNANITLGSEILSINGLSPKDINVLLRKHMYQDGFSSPNAEADISNYFRNAYSNFISNPDQFDIIIQDKNDIHNSLTLLALNKNDLDSIFNARYNSNVEVEKPLQFKIELATNTANYTIKSFRNEIITAYGQNFQSFTDSIFDLVEKQNIKHLIIDIRGNSGGWTANGKKLFSFFINESMSYISHVELSKIDSFSFSPLILSDQGINDTMEFEMNSNKTYNWINYPSLTVNPSGKNRFKGQVYVLIDEDSRSCSSVFSALMQSHTNAIFVGQENSAAQCGQGGMIIIAILPYTGINIRSSTAKYSLNVKHPNDTRGIQVHYRIKQSIEDYLNGSDPQIEFIDSLIMSNIEQSTY
ncbi:MAG: S41 family peptidase [Crocinitomicaceae bacterium]